MPVGLARVTNRTLLLVGVVSVAVILLLQAVIFGIWGDDGDPPDGFVVVAFILFWSSVLALLAVIGLAAGRRLSARQR